MRVSLRTLIAVLCLIPLTAHAAGPTLCLSLSLSNTTREAADDLALPVTVTVKDGQNTTVVQTTGTSSTLGTLDLADDDINSVCPSAPYTFTVRPTGHTAVSFTGSDLLSTCFTLPESSRAGDMTGDGTITDADLNELADAYLGEANPTATTTYGGAPTLANIVEAIRHKNGESNGTTAVPRLAYAGHPIIPNLTAITPKIAITRSGGVLPFVVQVQAANTTATFSDGGAAFEAEVGRPFDPYMDLEYHWDFGNPAGTETFTHPVTGDTVNANDNQTGPEAMYVYRNAGSSTITVTARAWNGDEFVTASTTELSVEEVQRFALIGAPTGGTYTLSFNGQTTAAIAHNAYSNAVCSALAALSTIGSGNIECYGGPQPSDRKYIYLFFRGGLAGTSQPLVIADASGLTGGTTPSITVIRDVSGGSVATVTATAFSGTDRYYDSNYDGSNGASDGTINRPYTDIANFRTWITGGNNRRALLKRGSSWTTTTTTKFENRNLVRVAAYGTGADPVITGSGNVTFGIFYLEIGYGATAADFVFSDLAVESASGQRVLFESHSGNGSTANPYGTSRYVYWLNGKIGKAGTDFVQVGWNTHIASGFWGTAFEADDDDEIAILAVSLRYFSIVGGYFAGGGQDDIFHHHLYPSIESHDLYRWIDFREADERSYCINANVHVYSSGGVDSPFHLIDGNNCTGTKHGFDFSNSNNDPNDTYMDKILLQNNAVHTGQIDAINSQGILAFNPATIVVRNNTFYNQESVDFSLGGTRKHLSLYGNKIWRNPGSVGRSFTLQGSGGYLRSNTFVSPRSADSLGVVNYNSDDVALWSVSGNQYYTPNYIVSASVKPFYDLDTSAFKTFDEWQSEGFDQTGCYVDPEWVDPENGDLAM